MSGSPTTRSLITAAVAAGVPAGLLYGLATVFLAGPVLFDAEAFETGAALVDRGLARTLWTLVGAVAVGTALSLILTPLLRAVGPPTWKSGLGIGTVAFCILFLGPSVLHGPTPPGSEHAHPVAARQAGWILMVLAFSGIAALTLGWRNRERITGTGLGFGIAVMALAAIGGGWIGGGMDTVTHLAPDHLVTRFQRTAIVCNMALFLGLAGLIPPALRRLGP